MNRYLRRGALCALGSWVLTVCVTAASAEDGRVVSVLVRDVAVRDLAPPDGSTNNQVAEDSSPSDRLKTRPASGTTSGRGVTIESFPIQVAAEKRVEFEADAAPPYRSPGADSCCGVEPRFRCLPNCRAEPSCGAVPSCRAEPSCSAEPSCGCDAVGPFAEGYQCGCQSCQCGCECECCEDCCGSGGIWRSKLLSGVWDSMAGLHQESMCNVTDLAASFHPDSLCQPCSCRRWGLVGFAGGDAWRGPVDGIDSNNFGARGGLNFGVVLTEGISGQIGASYAGYDFHGRTAGPESSAVEDQIFLTGGLYHRATCPQGDYVDRISWGFVYDYMLTDNMGPAADYVRLGQVRGRVGFALDACNEVGVWGASGMNSRTLDNAGVPGATVRGLDQISVFWNHKWQYGATTMGWVGLAEDPGEMTFGFRGEVPLSDCVGMYGNVQYILPSASANADPVNSFREEFWSVSFGFTVHLGGCARSCSVTGHRWMPLLPVADNGSFALEPGGF